MNRRNFLASLVALPAGLVVAAQLYSEPVFSSRQLWMVDVGDIDLVTDRHTAKAIGDSWNRYLRDRYGIEAR